MKFNGDKVKVYKDKVGPYDSYYYKGCLLSTITTKQTVSKAFDYKGEHIGIVRRYHNASMKSLCLTVLCIVVLIISALVLIKPEATYCIISRPERFVYAANGDVLLKITNKNPNELHIQVNGEEHLVGSNETLYSVPYCSSPLTVVYTYNNHSFTEEVEIFDS